LPWSEDLATQHGQSIKCLPYMLSPLPLLDKLKSMDHAQCKVSDNLRIVEPHSSRTRLVSITFTGVHVTPLTGHPVQSAAYPVLLPVYLAQYPCMPDWVSKLMNPGPAQIDFNATYILEAWSTHVSQFHSPWFDPQLTLCRCSPGSYPG
jgi:hypothetical protein